MSLSECTSLVSINHLKFVILFQRVNFASRGTLWEVQEYVFFVDVWLMYCTFHAPNNHTPFQSCGVFRLFSRALTMYKTISIRTTVIIAINITVLVLF